MQIVNTINNQIINGFLDFGCSNAPKVFTNLHSPRGHFSFGRIEMELIRRTRNVKLDNKSLKYPYRSYGLFWCPYCKTEVEKTISHGKINQSCGCAKKQLLRKAALKHDESFSPIYKIWDSMKCRCANKNDKHYGGKDISVCKEWLKYIPFRDWVLNNGYQKGLLIDRIDNNKNYNPDNVRFVTHFKSNLNREGIKLDWNKVCEIRKKYIPRKSLNKNLPMNME